MTAACCMLYAQLYDDCGMMRNDCPNPFDPYVCGDTLVRPGVVSFADSASPTVRSRAVHCGHRGLARHGKALAVGVQDFNFSAEKFIDSTPTKGFPPPLLAVPSRFSGNGSGLLTAVHSRLPKG
jgi:hypothetical protein